MIGTDTSVGGCAVYQDLLIVIRHNAEDMWGTSLIQPRWVSIIAALFFCTSGTFACLLLLLGATSFWYFLCAIFVDVGRRGLPLSAIVWSGS